MSHDRIRDRFASKVSDEGLGDNLYRATGHTVAKRASLIEQLGPSWERLRQNASDARHRSVAEQRSLIDRFVEVVKGRGWNVHFARDASEARRLAVELATEVGGTVVKSKSLTSEEIRLNEALEKARTDVFETDLGELIVQLAGEPPSHVTAPAIHMSTEQIARLFRRKLGMSVPSWVDDPVPADPANRTRLARQLSLRAREFLREKFLSASVGITGANFLVADSGTVVLLENEGNIQLTALLPKRHIIIAGIDKVIASDGDLQNLLPILPLSATAQRQTGYVSFFADPHPDLHVILLDNGRRALSEREGFNQVLRCIRCGACMNVCPVYRNAGGHAYDGAYPGPIGALLMPQLQGGDRHAHLPFACTVCGACSEVCPVKIPLDHLLLELRANLVEKNEVSDFRHTLESATQVMSSARTFHFAQQLYPSAEPLAELLPIANRWTVQRAMPRPTDETFRLWWSRHRPAPPPARKSRQGSSSPATSPLEQLRALAGSSERTHEKQIQNSFPAPATPLDLWKQRFSALGPDGETSLWTPRTWGEAIELLREHLKRRRPSSIACAPEIPPKATHDLGISIGELLIAQTGGVVMNYPSREHARVTALAVEQVVFAGRDHIVESVAEAIRIREQRRASGAWADLQVFVTGPSRTADIEKVLVIPAHGPRSMIVVLVDHSDLARREHWEEIRDVVRSYAL